MPTRTRSRELLRPTAFILTQAVTAGALLPSLHWLLIASGMA